MEQEKDIFGEKSLQLSNVESSLLSPKLAKSNMHISLFSELDIGKKSKSYSNSLTRLDHLPRFVRGKGTQIPRKDLASKSEEIKNPYDLRLKIDGEWQVESGLITIKPASIEKPVKGGEPHESEVFACYPSDSEELIEKVLFYLAAKNGLVIRDVGGLPRYGTSFTLYQIFNELKRRKKSRSYSQIKESLRILRDCQVFVTEGDNFEKPIPVFPEIIVEVGAAGKSKELCFVTFADYVVDEIMARNYRQLLFSKMTEPKQALSRWLYMYLGHHFQNAGDGNTYVLSVASVFRNYGKSKLSSKVKNRNMREALAELVNFNIIKAVPASFSKTNIHGEKDTLFEITPTEDFVVECIRANKKAVQLNAVAERIDTGAIESLPTQQRFDLLSKT